ncbi:MAG: hypothetical protein U0Q12_04500 [Vicinamibacterales bacterium]
MTRTILAIGVSVLTTGAMLVGADVASRLPLTYKVAHNRSAAKDCTGELVIDKWQFKYESADCPDESRTWRTTEIADVESKRPDELVLKSRESGAKTLGLERNFKFKVLGSGIEPDVVRYMRERVK